MQELREPKETELPEDWRAQLEADGYSFETVTERVEGGKWVFEAACKPILLGTGSRSYFRHHWIAAAVIGFGDYHTGDEFPWIREAETKMNGTFFRYADEGGFQKALWDGDLG